MQERHKPTSSTTEDKVYLVDLRTKERLSIQFLPEEIQTTRSISIADISVVSRNNPKHHWTGGKKEISFTFFLLADDESKVTAKMRMKWLESLSYQDKTTGASPQVLFIFGRQYRKDKWIVSKLSFKEKSFVPAFDFLPQWIEVSLALLSDNDKNEAVEDIRDSLAW